MKPGQPVVGLFHLCCVRPDPRRVANRWLKIAGAAIPAWKGDGAADLAGVWREALGSGYPEHETVEALIIEELVRPAESWEDLGHLWAAVGGLLGYAGGSYNYDPHYVSQGVVRAAVDALNRMRTSEHFHQYVSGWKEPSAAIGEMNRYHVFLASLDPERNTRGTTFSKKIGDEYRLLFLISDDRLLHVPMLANGHRLTEDDKIEILEPRRIG